MTLGGVLRPGTYRPPSETERVTEGGEKDGDDAGPVAGGRAQMEKVLSANAFKGEELWGELGFKVRKTSTGIRESQV